VKEAHPCETPVILILVAASLWSGYWFFGASATQSAFANWFAERRAEGWAADMLNLEVQGFPNRFDTTFTDITLGRSRNWLGMGPPRFSTPRPELQAQSRDRHLAQHPADRHTAGQL
jgi:hypothetical protein